RPTVEDCADAIVAANTTIRTPARTFRRLSRNIFSSLEAMLKDDFQRNLADTGRLGRSDHSKRTAIDVGVETAPFHLIQRIVKLNAQLRFAGLTEESTEAEFLENTHVQVLVARSAQRYSRQITLVTGAGIAELRLLCRGDCGDLYPGRVDVVHVEVRAGE